MGPAARNTQIRATAGSVPHDSAEVWLLAFCGHSVGLAAVLGDKGVDVGDDVRMDRGLHDGGQQESVLVGRHVGVEGLDGHDSGVGHFGRSVGAGGGGGYSTPWSGEGTVLPASSLSHHLETSVRNYKGREKDDVSNL